MIDTDMQARTGRTERMLRHAIKQAQNEKHVAIFGIDSSHARILVRQLGELVPDDEQRLVLRKRIIVLSFDNATQGNLGRHIGQYRNYDYRLNRFVRAVGPQGEEPVDFEVLIDHAALEAHRHHVLRYLRVTRSIANATRWMIDTARVMATLGRRTYVVTEDSDTAMIVSHEVKGYNVSVEDGTQMGNLNLLSQELKGAHPSCVLLIDPKMIEHHFDGALREMNRWNEK